MGNCIRKGTSTEWGGEDWGSFGSGDETRTHERVYGQPSTERKSLLGESKGVMSSSLAEGTEVKVKISKNQLEQLLKKAEVEGLSAKQVLADLMNDSDQLEAHQRSWKPALQSIPE